MKKIFVLFFLIIFIFACSNMEKGFSYGIYFAPQSSDNCIPTGNGDNNLPDDENVKKIVVRISGGNYKQPLIKAYSKEFLTKKGELIVEEIIPSKNYTVEVFVCDKNDAVIWSGLTENVSVEKHEKSYPSIYLTKTGTMNCTGNERKINGVPIGSKDMIKRAFHSTTLTPFNDVIIAGGVVEGSMTKGFSSTKSVEIYRSSLGIFQQYGEMIEGRASHLAFLVEKDAILFIGGSERLKIDNVGKYPPFSPEGFPEKVAELFSITKKKSEETKTSFPKILLSSGILVENEALICGGYEENGKLTSKIFRFPLNKEGMKNGNLEIKQGALSGERVGHSLTLLEDGSILVWGGKTDPIAEIIPAGEINGKEVQINLNGSFKIIPTSFHSAVLFENKILISGGIEIKPDGTFTPKAENAQILLLEVQKDEKGIYSIKIDSISAGEKSHLFKRAYYVSSYFEDGTFFVGGGFNSFTSPTDINIEECKNKGFCFLHNVLLFNLNGLNIEIKKEDIKLNSERVGHSLLILKDGTFLTQGGFSILKDKKSIDISNSAEIYNHPKSQMDKLCKTPIFEN